MELDVGLVAVFDGHNGAEASDMASKLLVEYFIVHLYFLLDGRYSAVLKKSSDKLIYGENNMALEFVSLVEMQNWDYPDRERYFRKSTSLYLMVFYHPRMSYLTNDMLSLTPLVSPCNLSG